MQSKKESVALSSVFASLFLTLIKLVVGLITGSMGIISEAAHSALDLSAALITYFAVRQSDRPADESHHYGHGKVENISAFVETILLVLTSIWIVYEAMQRLIHKSIEVEIAWYAFAVMIISIIIDVFRSRALSKVAKETQSQALEADALHFSTDIYSSSVVILGLILYSLGLKGADSFAAIMVALFVLYAAYRLGKRTIDELLDRAPEGLETEIRQIIDKVDGVAGMERIRVRKTGPTIFIDVIINVNRLISLENVDKITKNVQKAVSLFSKNSDTVVHVNPLAIEGESVIDRIKTIVSNHNFSAHEVKIYKQNGKMSISFDLEAESLLSLKDVHKKATHIEESIIEEFGKNVEVNIHLEPLDSQTSKSDSVSPEELADIYKILDKAKRRFKSIGSLHNLVVNKTKGKYHLALHCTYTGSKTIKDTHVQASHLEEKIKSLSKLVESVNVHVEPTNSKNR